MSILHRFLFEFKIHDSLEDFDLSLWPGEVWLSTEPVKMTWLEAIEIAASHSHLRLPWYSDLIRAEQSCRKNPELRKKFSELEEGEFWSIGSEGYDSSKPYACCLTKTHDSYESHHAKFERKWVRYVLRGPAESPEVVQSKKEEREKNRREEERHEKIVKAFRLDTPEGRRDLEIHCKLMDMTGISWR